MLLWNQIVSWVPAVILQGILVFLYSIHFYVEMRMNLVLYIARVEI